MIVAPNRALVDRVVLLLFNPRIASGPVADYAKAKQRSLFGPFRADQSTTHPS